MLKSMLIESLSWKTVQYLTKKEMHANEACTATAYAFRGLNHT
jgi:hypothetical protein